MHLIPRWRRGDDPKKRLGRRKDQERRLFARLQHHHNAADDFRIVAAPLADERTFDIVARKQE